MFALTVVPKGWRRRELLVLSVSPGVPMQSEARAIVSLEKLADRRGADYFVTRDCEVRVALGPLGRARAWLAALRRGAMP